MTDATTAAPAGWYPDPSLVDTVRYWDGSTWTDHRAPATARTRTDDGSLPALSKPEQKRRGYWRRYGGRLPRTSLVTAILLGFLWLAAAPNYRGGALFNRIDGLAWLFFALVVYGPLVNFVVALLPDRRK